MMPPPSPRSPAAAPESPGPPGCQRAGSGSRPLELLALIHVVSLLVFTSWDFGGETDFARKVISSWGSLAAAILGYACLRRWRHHEGLPSAVRWLWPLVLFNLLVIASARNPSFTRSVVGGVTALINSGARSGLPSSAQPVGSLRALWQFDAIFLTCFNLAVVVTRRRALRGLLLVLTVNALALAVMGTFQKLGQSAGLYFGWQPSPNVRFFASFIYPNHWGAFILMCTAAALGLWLHFSHPEDRARRHSPAAFGLVATLFLAASVPLSGSRSCSLLVLALLTGALLHWILALRQSGHLARRAKVAAAVLALTVFFGGLGGIFLLARPVIEVRIETTQAQIADIRMRGDLGSRRQLYVDTWRMACQKPWFGWGLGSYGTVFQCFNQQLSVDGWVPFYAQAHSDWLQMLAEVGVIGTLLIALLGGVPLLAVCCAGRLGQLPACLLAGCALLIAYALVEFPFANPAVMIAFWLCFFTAVRYRQLTTYIASDPRP